MSQLRFSQMSILVSSSRRRCMAWRSRLECARSSGNLAVDGGGAVVSFLVLGRGEEEDEEEEEEENEEDA